MEIKKHINCENFWLFKLLPFYQHSNFTFSWDKCSICRSQQQQNPSSQSKRLKMVTMETALSKRLNKMAIIQGKCATGVGRRSIIRERKLSWCFSVCVQDAALRKETYSIKAKNIFNECR